MSTKILIAEDEVNIADAIAYALRREGYTVYIAYDGGEAMELINRYQPGILILDIMMPKMNGYDICREVNTLEYGIIMLTAKKELVNKVLGLELGADDYMTKPFEMQELIARVRSLSRRLQKNKYNNTEETEIITIGDLSIKLSERAVFLKEDCLELKPKEYDLLVHLFKHPQKIFTREMILEQVWGMDYYGSTRTIDIHIQRIRKKLGCYGDLIQTVTKIGYKVVMSLD